MEVPMSSVRIELRAFSWDALPTVVDVINRSDAADGLDGGTSEAELGVWWRSPSVKPERHAFLAVVDSDVVGYGRVELQAGNEQTGFSTFNCRGKVLPSWRGRGVGTRIVAECERRARSRLDEAPTRTVYLRTFADKRQQDVAELLAAFDLKPVRYFFDMVYDAVESPAEPTYPPGYSARTFIPGEDEETTWRVIDTAFRDHWGYVPFPLEEWLHWIGSRYFDPELTILGVGPGGEVVGECLCMIYPENNRRRGREEGWIDSLAVLREHRKKGLGRALLVDGMHRLRARGCTHLLLGVDSENPTGALGLYESVGFRGWKTGVNFRKVLRE
jgi:mycothiol synthase